jgi:hypothetical protein
VNNKFIDKEIQELISDEIFTDKELGLNENDYLDKNGHYKEDCGRKYFNDRNYLTFKKFHSKMKQTHEVTKKDFNILRNNYNNKEDYDYSFVKSPVLRYLLFDESYNNDNVKNDPCFPLLDIEVREIMKNLIKLLKTSENYDLMSDIVDKIEQIKKTDYIFTEKEKKETIIPLLIYSKKH